MMEQRITLVSDTTEEFKDNTPASFKVRLASPLNLSEGQWEATLLSLSAPSRGHHHSILHDNEDRIAIRYQFKVGSATLFSIITYKQLMQDPPITSGTSFWGRVEAILYLQQMAAMQQQGSNKSMTNGDIYRVHLTGDMASIRGPTDKTLLMEIDKDLAVKFGMLKFDGSTAQLGLNISCISLHATGGGSLIFPYQSLTTTDLSTTGGKIWKYDSSNERLILHPFFQWRIFNVNDSFQSIKRSKSLFVYCDLIKSTFVGNQQHQLLREVYMKEDQDARQMVEPKRLQWIPLAKNTVEVIEIQIAGIEGTLVKFTPGKTVVNLSLRKI